MVQGKSSLIRRTHTHTHTHTHAHAHAHAHIHTHLHTHKHTHTIIYPRTDTHMTLTDKKGHNINPWFKDYIIILPQENATIILFMVSHCSMMLLMKKTGFSCFSIATMYSSCSSVFFSSIARIVPVSARSFPLNTSLRRPGPQREGKLERRSPGFGQHNPSLWLNRPSYFWLKLY